MFVTFCCFYMSSKQKYVVKFVILNFIVNHIMKPPLLLKDFPHDTGSLTEEIDAFLKIKTNSNVPLLSNLVFFSHLTF